MIRCPQSPRSLELGPLQHIVIIRWKWQLGLSRAVFRRCLGPLSRVLVGSLGRNGAGRGAGDGEGM